MQAELTSSDLIKLLSDTAGPLRPTAGHDSIRVGELRVAVPKIVSVSVDGMRALLRTILGTDSAKAQGK